MLRPVLPAVRPFRAGAHLPRSLRAHAGARRRHARPRPDGRARRLLGPRLPARPRRLARRGAVLAPSTHLIGTSARTSSRSSCSLAGVLLLTGASVAGVLQATGDAAWPTPRARCAPQPTSAAAPAAPPRRRVGARRAGPVPEPATTWWSCHARRGARRSTARERYPDLFGDAPDRPTSRGDRAAHPPQAEPEPELEPEPDPSPTPEPAQDAAATTRRSSESDPSRRRRRGGRVLELPAAHGTRGRHRVRRPGPARAQALHRRARSAPTPPARSRSPPRWSRRSATSASRPRSSATVAGPHITRYELRLAPGVEDEQGRPAQGRPRLRAGRDRDPHPRADPRQAGRRRRGPQRATADRPPRRRLPARGPRTGRR